MDIQNKKFENNEFHTILAGWVCTIISNIFEMFEKALDETKRI